MWLEGGKLREFGEINEVCDHYAEYVDYYNALSDADKKKERDEKFAKRVIPQTKKKSLLKRIFG